MFQEKNSFMNLREYTINKFPNAKIVGESVKSFSSINEELNALKNGVGLRISLNSTIVELKGKDVLDYLHRVSTNAVTDLKQNEVRTTLFLNEKGKLIDRTLLISLEDKFILLGSEDKENRLFSWINKFIISDDVASSLVADKYSIVQMMGNQCDSFLTLFLGKDGSEIEINTIKRFDVDGFTIYVLHVKGPNNNSVYKLLVEKNKWVDFIDYLFTCNSVFDLSLIGDDAFEQFRIENGIPVFPNEINDSINPHEINLVQDINFKKGCYIGQEVISRLETYDKVQRKLMTIVLENQFIEQLPATIYDEQGTEIGEVTSISNYDNKNSLGLALVRKKIVLNGSKFFVNGSGEKKSVKIVELKNQ